MNSADEELWGIIGLVHDVDYEEHPDEHLRHAPEVLRNHEWPEECVAESIGLKGNPGGGSIP